ncbi:MAG: TetR/AcrR family transcriptional regulator [Lachnospiraceae bacterium]|nr:TetR/AcrR family transcriptional regulator [Lachnospiraceae bacterium]
MDKRVEKTQNAIKEAFMELRTKKPMEKITVTELCKLACINKSTFYDHYEDIYTLSERLEIETVVRIIESIPRELDYTFENPEVFTKELSIAFAKNMPYLCGLWRFANA